MKRLKELLEKRGAKAKEARTLIDTANAAKRALTAEENTKIDALQKEVEDIDAGIAIESRQLAIESAKTPQLSEGEKRDFKRFDYQRALRSMLSVAKGQNSTLDGVEAELFQEGEREARASGIESGGLFLPRSFVVRSKIEREVRDMTATGQTSAAGDQGGMTISTEAAGLLDDFYARGVLEEAGATVIHGMVGNLNVPRLVAGTAGAKKTENAASDEVTHTTAKTAFTPKRLPAYIDISEQLVKQASSAIEAILRSSLTNQMIATKEAAFFHGTGTSEALGIAATSGIGSVVGGDNGLAPAFSHIVGLETAVDTSNALLGNLGYFSNGQIRGKLKQTPVVASTDSRMILGDSGLLNGYTPRFTNAISRTLTKGNQSLSSAIFFGNAADYWITYWGGMSLELVRDKTLAIAGEYTLVSSLYYDGGLVRPKSFAAMLDALGA